MLKNIVFVVLVLFSFACSERSCISVFSENIDNSELVSRKIKTPDPRSDIALCGEKLTVSWKIPSTVVLDDSSTVVLQVRYKDRSCDKVTIPVVKRNDKYIFSLVNKRYFEKIGIGSYKVELVFNDTIVDKWQHKLWVEPIEFNV